MRWWNWLLVFSPPALLAIVIRINWAADWSAAAGSTFSTIGIPLCLLAGMAGICFSTMLRTTRAMAGILYAAVCPFAMMYAGIVVACPVGDCL